MVWDKRPKPVVDYDGNCLHPVKLCSYEAKPNAVGVDLGGVWHEDCVVCGDYVGEIEGEPDGFIVDAVKRDEILEDGPYESVDRARKVVAGLRQ